MGDYWKDYQSMKPWTTGGQAGRADFKRAITTPLPYIPPKVPKNVLFPDPVTSVPAPIASQTAPAIPKPSFNPTKADLLVGLSVAVCVGCALFFYRHTEGGIAVVGAIVAWYIATKWWQQLLGMAIVAGFVALLVHYAHGQ
jgi:hypothetical protein